MSTPTAPTLPAPRAPRARQPRRTPAAWELGQPDPRPVTGYSVTWALVGGNTVVTVVLEQPCVIRSPRWSFINSVDGTRILGPAATIVDNRTFFFQFAGKLGDPFGIIEVPYQDMQVQNSQGGYVSPGGKWFRTPA